MSHIVCPTHGRELACCAACALADMRIAQIDIARLREENARLRAVVDEMARIARMAGG